MPFCIKNMSITILLQQISPLGLLLGCVQGRMIFGVRYERLCFNLLPQFIIALSSSVQKPSLCYPMPFINGLSQVIHGKIPCVYFTGS